MPAVPCDVSRRRLTAGSTELPLGCLALRRTTVVRAPLDLRPHRLCLAPEQASCARVTPHPGPEASVDLLLQLSETACQVRIAEMSESRRLALDVLPASGHVADARQLAGRTRGRLLPCRTADRRYTVLLARKHMTTMPPASVSSGGVESIRRVRSERRRPQGSFQSFDVARVEGMSRRSCRTRQTSSCSPCST